jgi:hypothetical protein
MTGRNEPTRMNRDVGPSPREIAARYCEMWNTGNSSIAAEILSSGWVDHAHPEVATRLVWLIRLKDGQMTEMWTYRDMTR